MSKGQRVGQASEEQGMWSSWWARKGDVDVVGEMWNNMIRIQYTDDSVGQLADRRVANTKLFC